MRLIIIGAGGYGRTVADVARQSGKYESIGFLDDNESLDANDSLEDIKVQDDTSILTDLATLLKDNPGKLKLSMVVRDSTRSKQPLYLRSRLPGVKLNRQIFDFIASHESLHVTMPV